MGRKKTSNTEKLLNAIKKSKSGMTRKQMVTFLLKLNGRSYEPQNDRGSYSSLLYGDSSRERTGILERFCEARRDNRWPEFRASARWVIAPGAKIKAPFTTSY